MIKKILIALVAIVVIALFVGVLLPRHTQVQRSVLIARPPSLIFAVINSFQLFPRWSPWQDLDPNMHQRMEGPRDGVGAKLLWSGNKNVGSGTQIITGGVPGQSVDSDLDFSGNGVAKSVMSLSPEGSGTRVTWSLDIDMGANPVGHYFGLMMDGMIGKDFAAGLDKLKTLMESLPNEDIAGFAAEQQQLESRPLLVVTETVQPTSAAIGQAYADGFGKIGKVITKNKLTQAGAPLGIDVPGSGGGYSFDAGIPVSAAAGGSMPQQTPANAEGVRLIQSYGGAALKTTHVGAYDALPKTHAKLLAYMAAHGLAPKGAVMFWYVDDPGSTPAEKVRTEIYQPIG
jgi:effector-binding domain-containing protein